MAIYSAVPPPDQQGAATTFTPGHQHTVSDASTAPVDIEAWTVSALESLSISPVAVGTGKPLTISLDEHSSRAAPVTAMKLRNVTLDVPVGASITPRRTIARRDSLKRREALLKGNEGSRQRRRWENDRLLHLPQVEPPLPSDWDIQPTHPVHHIPYQLASYWDLASVRERASQPRRAKPTNTTPKIPADLRLKAKRTPAVKSWLRVLEEPVRQFLVQRSSLHQADESDSLDSSDEEIVFVGRNGLTEDKPKPSPGYKRARREKKGTKEEGMVIEELVDADGDEESAAFKRWLTHSISDYYGLDSKSVLVGKPAKKVVYIGIKEVAVPVRGELPRPLWELF